MRAFNAVNRLPHQIGLDSVASLARSLSVQLAYNGGFLEEKGRR